MPSTKRSIDRARGSRSERAGGEPLGETPATPSGILSDMPDDLRGKLPDDVVDQLLAGARTEEEIVGPGGLLSQLTKRLVERALEVELTDHVGMTATRSRPATRHTRTRRSWPTVTRSGMIPPTTSTAPGNSRPQYRDRHD
jgi:hypothetical protein